MAESLHILLGTSACLQWLCHSGERTVARGPLVLFLCFSVLLVLRLPRYGEERANLSAFRTFVRFVLV